MKIIRLIYDSTSYTDILKGLLKKTFFLPKKGHLYSFQVNRNE